MQECYWHLQFHPQPYSLRGITALPYLLHLQNSIMEMELLHEAQATVLTLSGSMVMISWLSLAQFPRPGGDVSKVGGVFWWKQ